MNSAPPKPGDPAWAWARTSVHLSVQPTSCRCGGDWAWVVSPGNDPGLMIMLGCICHHSFVQVAAMAERFLTERGYLPPQEAS